MLPFETLVSRSIVELDRDLPLFHVYGLNAIHADDKPSQRKRALTAKVIAYVKQSYFHLYRISLYKNHIAVHMPDTRSLNT